MLSMLRERVLGSEPGSVGPGSASPSHSEDPAAQQGATLEAAGPSDAALALNRADAETWNSLGEILLLEGDTARAADAFRDALRFDPGYPTAHRNLAVVLDQEGRPGEAVAHYEAFLRFSTESDPGLDDVRRRLAELFSVSGSSRPIERSVWLPLGQMLLNDGVLTQEQLAHALARQRKTKDRLGQVLIEMKLLDEEVLLRYLGRQFRKEAITQQELETLDLDVVKLVPTGLEPKPRERSPEGIKALFYAIEKNNLVYAQKVLSMNFDPNLLHENGYTPLAYAAMKGNPAMIELLLRNGADASLVSKEGDTPVELALRMGHNEVADLLKKARRTAGLPGAEEAQPAVQAG